VRYQHKVRGSSNHTLSSIIMTPTEKVTWSFYMVKYSLASRESMFLHNVDTMMPQSYHNMYTVLPCSYQAATTKLPQWLHTIATKLPQWLHTIAIELPQYLHSLTVLVPLFWDRYMHRGFSVFFIK
jgi:hypothetical protein